MGFGGRKAIQNLLLVEIRYGLKMRTATILAFSIRLMATDSISLVGVESTGGVCTVNAPESEGGLY